MNTKIAIVEDEPKLSALLKNYLVKADYQVDIYDNGDVALEALLDSPPDLILLDLMLPGTDGISVCKEFRKTSDVPIIMMTALVEEIDRLLGLELGADDYICKPFSPREMVARVKAILRRTQKPRVAEVNDRVAVDMNSARVVIDGEECELTALELKLLDVMYNKPGQIFNRAQLMNRIYPDGRIVSDRTIDSHVKKLRQKLGSLKAGEHFIHSVYGIGYKFEMTNKS